MKPGKSSSSHSSSSGHSNTRIQLAAYESEAPRLTSGRDEDSQTRSVVVNHDDSNDGFRTAQTTTPTTGNSSNNKVEDGLRSPFTDNPEESSTSPKFGTPKVPDTGTNSTTNTDNSAQEALEKNNNSALQLNQQQGELGANRVPPPKESNEIGGQFQPVLPAGPGPDQTSPTPITPTAEANIKQESEKAKESCDKSLENLKAYTVDKVKLDIAITGTEGEDYPFECSIDNGEMHAGRCWEQTTYMWKASAMCHKPLYFEDEQLERYGHSYSPLFQPFISGAHFFCHVPVLPYCMGVEPPNECIYALGHYRPGSCAPYMINPIPLSPRGALFEAGVFTGGAAIFP